MVRLVVAFAGYKNFRNFFVPLYKCKKILFLLHSGGINFEGKQILRIYFKNEAYFPLVAYEKQPAGIPFGPYS